ncbi:MAG: hypothetical protein AAFN93_27490, partial [Bacteroidota bacterium]
VKTWEILNVYSHKIAIKSMVISPNNNYLFCAGLNGIIKIWRLNQSSKKAVRSLKGHKGAIYSLA